MGWATPKLRHPPPETASLREGAASAAPFQDLGVSGGVGLGGFVCAALLGEDPVHEEMFPHGDLAGDIIMNGASAQIATQSGQRQPGFQLGGQQPLRRRAGRPSGAMVQQLRRIDAVLTVAGKEIIPGRVDQLPPVGAIGRIDGIAGGLADKSLALCNIAQTLGYRTKITSIGEHGDAGDDASVGENADMVDGAQSGGERRSERPGPILLRKLEIDQSGGAPESGAGFCSVVDSVGEIAALLAIL